ncbi:DUF3309 family protein [Maritalea myrionectae]|uniref:DUF3309 domain-containing protein n=1 Tax=Maritalea myrionectae TaxID=454601 RepID=A0A2R4MCD1_9HYPH|nr:DUF3309 family protein [Maritalea myrionectae]AVX03660.1 hypothetical protein MXMO3_01129 [Maritalea myrionectae]
MGFTTLILLLLIISVVGSAPAWPYSRGWGYRPVGLVGIILVAFLLIWMLGYI